MYTCKNIDCSNKTLYSTSWVTGRINPMPNCTACGTQLELADKEPVRTLAINTKGCSGGSLDFTH